MAGYSGTPLAAKLGIKPGALVCALHAPRGYAALLGRLPQGADLRAKFSAKADIVHLFTARKAELAQVLKTYRETLGPAAAIWVSWPKKSSKVPTDLTEDAIRALALPLGLVDVKVCAVTEVWSGLKLVLRKELR
ncbi:MAG: hypothetical protein WD793_12775 [Steroidobacteraceae bacterium]